MNGTCSNFAFRDLTVGQVAASSSAAAGGGAVQPWVQALVELVRKKVRDMLKGPMGLLCADIYKMLTESIVTPCNRDIVLKEMSAFMGCQGDGETIEKSAITAKRWTRFLQKMAIKLNASSPTGGTHAGHMAIDAVGRTNNWQNACYGQICMTCRISYFSKHKNTHHPHVCARVLCSHSNHSAVARRAANTGLVSQGYNDNSGLGILLSQYLQSDSNQAQILVLVVNELGDHQIRTYFNAVENTAGMVCDEGEVGMEELFTKIKVIHRKSFTDVGGEYIERGRTEKTCAIRLASNVFFEVHTGRGFTGKVVVSRAMDAFIGVIPTASLALSHTDLRVRIPYSVS